MKKNSEQVDDQSTYEVTLSREEYSLVNLLRQFKYGKFSVYKQHDKPVRVEWVGSYMIPSDKVLFIDGNIPNANTQ